MSKEPREEVVLTPHSKVILETTDGSFKAIARSTESAQAALQDHYSWLRERERRSTENDRIIEMQHALATRAALEQEDFMRALELESFGMTGYIPEPNRGE